MRDFLQMRRWQIVTAVVVLICFVALVVPHSVSSGSLLACVLFFPVFLFGLLDLAEFMRNAVSADDSALPSAPVLDALFQRPPPSFE
jgi:hypothetical protein